MPRSMTSKLQGFSMRAPAERRIILLLAGLVSLFVVSGCGTGERYARVVPTQPPEHAVYRPDPGLEPTQRPYEIKGVRYYPIPDSEGFVEYGDFSWYGRKFHGRSTSSGEIYDMFKQSAAHKTLPMGTWVRAINLANGKEIVVRINDRGPFIKGRILDLSYAAARELDLIGPGTAPGKIIALAPEESGIRMAAATAGAPGYSAFRTGVFTVQIGAFSNRGSAQRLAERLEGFFDNVTITAHATGDGRVVHRVRVSRAETLSQARMIEQRLAGMGFTDTFVVRL